MTFKISFQNSGGELDSRAVATEAELKDALIEMIEAVDHIDAGDKFIVSETAE